MFLKWPKTYRILVNQIDIKGKHFLSDKEVKLLLGGRVSITEKIDGANVGIIRLKDEFRLQKRGSLVGDSEHAQFQFFKAWSYNNYDKLMRIPKDNILYGELTYAKHTVFYDNLPDYFIAFCLADRKTGEFYHRDELVELCEKIGLSYTPEVARDYFNRDELFDLIPKISHFGNQPAEGIVVENLKRKIRGKVVRKEFQKSMDQSGHWMHKAFTKNLLGDKR